MKTIINGSLVKTIQYLGFFPFLLLCKSSYSQEPSVVSAFNSYSHKALLEKIFVHTDKEFYVAGELVWFKLYYVNGPSYQSSQFSRIAYVEVLNEKNEAVLQSKILLKQGECNGSLYLPLSLNTGNYIVRAYTNWMKNFDADYFFTKKITVVNTLKSPESAPATNASPGITINFFPEGGSLVSGLKSRVGFEAKDKNGTINNFHGYIVSNNNDTVASFNPLKFGIGSFDFTPENRNNYKAIIILPDSTVISKSLPATYENGYVMRVSENKLQQQIIVEIKRKPMSGEPNIGQALLIAHTNQSLKIAEKAFIADSATFIIDKSKLGKGVFHFTLFGTNNKPVCERLFYVRPESRPYMDVRTNRNEYKERQKIELSMHSGIVSAPDNLSVSVFSADSLQNAESLNIYNYMWLASDIAGYIESPDYYFSDDPDVTRATDNLMLTHGWRRFKWEEVIKADNAFVKYLPEINGHLITGRVIDSRNGQPVAGINTYLSVTGNPFGFYSAKSDKNGIVQYEVKNYYGNAQVIAQPAMAADSFYSVTILKPFAEKFSSDNYSSYNLNLSEKNSLLQRSINMQLQNIYTGDSLRNFRAPSISDTLPFYGIPQISYKLDDYKRFTTMEEVLREYVSEIGVGMRNGKPVLKIFNPQEHDFYKGYELVLLDGIPLADANRIFSYDPLKIKKLEIVQSRYALGQSIFDGIASFSTYEGSFDGFDLDTRLIAIDYPGLQAQREFYSPVYETEEQIKSRIPDFRTTLFWTPDLNTDKNGNAALQFYSGDKKGRYIVVVQGVSEKGDFIAGTTTFEVK